MARYITSPLGVKNLRKAFPKEENRTYDVYHSTCKKYWSIVTDDEKIIAFMKKPYPMKPYYFNKEK